MFKFLISSPLARQRLTSLLSCLVFSLFFIRLIQSFFNLGHATLISRVACGVLVARISLFILYVHETRVSRRVTWRLALAAATPKSVKLWARLEANTYRYFVLSFRKVAPPWKPGYKFYAKSEYNSLIYLAVLSVFVELPFLYFLSRVTLPPKFGVHFDLVCLVLTLFSLVFLRADWFAIKNSAHYFDDETINLFLGFRINGRIQISDIEHSRLLSREDRTKEAIRKILSKDVFVISPLDRPNVILKLNKHIDTLHHFYRGQIRSNCIALYVDRPEEFLRHLKIQSLERPRYVL